MRTHRPLLARATLAATVFLALAGSVEALYQTVALHRDSRVANPAVGVQRTGVQDERLRPLREHLPPRGVVGYASDGWSGSAFTTVEALQDYFLTQYAVAPVIVLRGAGLPIVVGNYPADSAAEPAVRRTYPAGLVLRRDLGNGVLLLEGGER
ncbi:MAG: hypothetical protein JSW46_16720 [Gemmatimonadota bacterium]|nr:MAG: hypothetical protein JSW46_16720 [Gemmatimonadota bacterium]